MENQVHLHVQGISQTRALEEHHDSDYVLSENQLADPLTKPTSSLVNSTVFPQWGLVRLTSASSA